jgi:hypothetical protein
MWTWLRRLWAKLNRDDAVEIARARELFRREMVAYYTVDTGVSAPHPGMTHDALNDLERWAGVPETPVPSPENSPEAPAGEEPKSL